MATIAPPDVVSENDSLSAYGHARSTVTGTPLSADELRKTDAYWRACNYLSLGMIYLLDNPLLTEPLRPEHIKNRLLGHWGSSPGLSFIYVHLNRLIKKYDLDMIFLAGPGHGAPGVLGPAYLEGTYSEVYPEKSEDYEGLREFFKQFSFPGGIGSHCTPETPGSIHEGGELGYVLSHACGAAFDNPELIVAAVVGDGESETGPLATSWHINKFLNPTRDGAVLPIYHLNGYKINNPTLMARIPHRGTGEPASRLWLDAILRGGLRPRQHASGDGRDGGALRQRDSRNPEFGACCLAPDAPALADDRFALAQGLDRSPGSRGPSPGRLLARAPGAAAEREERPRAASHPGELDAFAASRRTVRWTWPLRAGVPRACSHGHPAHERQPRTPTAAG